ncbi:MAG: histidine phosphatase family protein [Bacteroidota bacterium]
MSRLLYIRHGQASYGQANYDQLSPLGYAQATSLGSYLLRQEQKFDAIYVGPLQRHHQTLEMVQEEYAKAGVELPPPVEMAELVEHRGPQVLKELLPRLRHRDKQIDIWQSEIEADITLKVKNGLLIFDRAMALWAQGELDDIHPKEYAKWPAFRTMVEQGLERVICEHSDQKGQHIGMFTSGGTIAATIGRTLQMADHARVISLNGIVQNASMTEILFSNHRITLKSFNRVPHLSDDQLTYV